MKQIELTQGFYAIIDDEDFERIKNFTWYLVNNGYVQGNGKMINGKRSRVLLHRFILNVPKGMIVDHINHDKLDNRKENLRICTVSQNAQNRYKHQTGTSNFKGVSWNVGEQKWVSYISIEGKRIHLGYFNDEIKAALAYNNKAKELFGEYALLNDIPEVQVCP